MSSVINFFDGSYVINLPSRQDRREAMVRELERAGVSLPSDKLVIFPAIKPTDKDDFPSIGARGCFLSHLAVLTEARNRHLNNVLIMEDDLSFTQQFIKYQNVITDKLRCLDWDFLYLGHVETSGSVETIGFQEFSQDLWTTSFVAINGRIIPRLITFLEEVAARPPGHPMGGPMHVDGAYSTFRSQNQDVTTLIATPSLGFQRPSPSDIAGWKWFDYVPLLNQLADVARKVKRQ
jgi:hypothetical protein